jgi:hypothetical protein
MTGHALVDKIGNQDLFPDEGYAFPRRVYSKQTKSYRSSALFPFNPEINRRARERTQPHSTSTLDDKPPTPFVDPPLRFGRTGRRKAILAATLDTRSRQLQYQERLSEYNRNHTNALEAQRNAELEACNEELAAERTARRREQVELRTAYQEQLQSVAQRRQREQQEAAEFDERLKEQQRRTAAEEAAKREKQRTIRGEMAAEYNRKNADMQQARERRIAAEKDEEKRLQLENAEIQRQRDERAAEDERRRLEKTRFRARVCEAQARNIAEMQSKQEAEQQIAESATASNEERRLLEKKERQQQMDRDRHAEWLRLQREREARRLHSTKKPFPRRPDEADADALEAQRKRQENTECRLAQRQQIEERRQAQREQAEKTKRLEQEMLDASKARFDQSLSRLQTLVPAELDIKVPAYVPKSTFST